MIPSSYEYGIRDHSDRFRHSFKLILGKVLIDNYSKTIHFCAILIFVLILDHMGNASASEVMKLSENDSGKTVEISVGDELEIVMPGNPTTGYVWEVISHHSNVLRLVNTIFYADNKAIGAGGMEIIKFHAIADGKTELKLIFHRSFEHNIPPLKTFEATIIIRK